VISLHYVRESQQNMWKNVHFECRQIYIFRKSKIIFEKSKMDIYKCPKWENENTFGKKNMLKIREKAETIKKFKIWHLKKVF
jgi:hypothetical protein